ncbi:uncharacterized protein LOC124928946 [Impatiens glandulifera]|uniref:uncharacterized protein LOC124928946 n=1 Tax=Impatiens glandulifera TaxID=253017 RepID=UPI001FB06D53|nr:uncharacterized protein LOC124928946 [Impatiens glandulifera]
MGEDRKPTWKTVPQFGGWDQNHGGDGGYTNYSVVFSRARENKKQQMTNIPRPTFEFQQEIVKPERWHHEEDNYVMRKKKKRSCLTCCISP